MRGWLWGVAWRSLVNDSALSITIAGIYNVCMVIRLPQNIEDQLQMLADSRGRPIDALVEEAIRQFLDASAITDVTAEDVGQTQMRLANEFKDTPVDQYPEEAA